MGIFYFYIYFFRGGGGGGWAGCAPIRSFSSVEIRSTPLENLTSEYRKHIIYLSLGRM